MGPSFSAGGTGWAAVELKPKSIWVVQPYEFLVSVMVDLDPAMPQTSTIQMLDQFSQCCRRANAECKVIQPGLFLVVGSGDSLHKKPALLPGLGHERHDGLRKALAVWSARLRPSGVLPTVTATFGRPCSETGTHHDDLANVIAVVSERLPQHGEQGGGALRVVGMRRANFLR